LAPYPGIGEYVGGNVVPVGDDLGLSYFLVRWCSKAFLEDAYEASLRPCKNGSRN